MYGKPCKRDWVAKVVFLIQFLTFGGRYNRYFWDTRLKMPRFVNFNILFQLVLTKFFHCFRVYRKWPPKVGHLIKSCKEPIEVNPTESTLRVLYMTYLSASLRNQHGVLPLNSFFKSNESRTSKDLPYIVFLFGVMTRAEHFKAFSFYWSWRKNPHASWWKSPD